MPGDLHTQIARGYPGEAHAIVVAAVERLIDYQDEAYAREFLARLARFRELDSPAGELTAETARQLALAMAYEDTVRVADLKIRASRFARVRAEVRLADGQLLEIAEFFHPRTQEIADTLPAPLGRWLIGTPWARGIVDRLTRRGRVVKTTSIGGFLLLYTLARMKPMRRRSLRFAREQAGIATWLDLVAETARTDRSLAREVARMRALVKGYGDTHDRGRSKFERLAALLPELRGRSDAATALGQLTKAALADEDGRALEQAIADFAIRPGIPAHAGAG
jgi:indolepyruvate ferredoxin oxidoreductase, beta subunit